MTTPWIIAFDTECLKQPTTEKLTELNQTLGQLWTFEDYEPARGAKPLQLHLARVEDQNLRASLELLQKEMLPGWFNIAYKPPLNKQDGYMAAFFDTTPPDLSGIYRLQRGPQHSIVVAPNPGQETADWYRWKVHALEQPTITEAHLDLGIPLTHFEQFRARSLGMAGTKAAQPAPVLPQDFAAAV